MDASPAEAAATPTDAPLAGPSQSVRPVLACRRMSVDDLDAVTNLLCEGFPERPRTYWTRALDRLARRPLADDVPRFGYVMTDGGRPVGVILVIVSDGPDGRRGNVSSWYVAPAYRGFSHMLLSVPLRLKETVLVNISPAPWTIDTIAAQGFREYGRGSVLALAALGRPVPGARVRATTGRHPDPLLATHRGWGCLTFEVEHRGTTYPFVFARSRFLDGRLPCAQLVYCASLDALVRFAGPLGRRLLRHGLPTIAVDANEMLPGLLGRFRPGRGRRFYRGGQTPRLGDLSFTELAIFGA